MLITFLVFIILMIFFFFLNKFILTISVKKFVSEKHELCEYILDNKKPPKKWLNKSKNNEKTKKYCLKNINKLIKYFEISKLIESEETREKILCDLNEICLFWKDSLEGEINAS